MRSSLCFAMYTDLFHRKICKINLPLKLPRFAYVIISLEYVSQQVSLDPPASPWPQVGSPSKAVADVKVVYMFRAILKLEIWKLHGTSFYIALNLFLVLHFVF